MRTKKAVKNLTYNLIFYIIASLLGFVTRKIFINELGVQIAGLNSLFSSVLGFLNLAELGIESAVIFALYKPLAQDEKENIKGIIVFYQRLYRIAGIVILLLGLISTIFLPFFAKGQVNSHLVKVYFVIYILNTVVTYLFSSKLSLLNVDQKSYIISSIDGIMKILKSVAQILILIVYKSFLLYLALEALFSLIYYAYMNRIINKQYPWLKECNAVLDSDTKKSIFKNIKALSYHKIGSFVVYSTDYLVMSAFSTLSAVGMYSNYIMVINFFLNAIVKMFNGITASIGNLIIEDNSQKNYDVFKKLFLFNYWIVVFITISLYNTMDYFIAIWLGKQYFVSRFILIIALVNFYITALRPCVERFKEAAGIYNEDKYAPIAESIINLGFSILFAKYMGIAGVVLGTVVSDVAVIFWVKPLLVYKKVFRVSFKNYLLLYGKTLLLAIGILIISSGILKVLVLPYNFYGFMLNCMLNVVIINLILILVFRKTEEYSYLKNLVMSKFKIKTLN
ncbi:lipopolysaccharide biosynthesis protein [Clostridium omnivorum]|uniref:Sugar translocase n=1 Tax=Clostridium omnivorum TaxID=1604902 RepID=A0ABQ5N3K2_9CLOT|nr:O-unit flippase [Clostridium sp. E14]GLC29724.1 sugar translocase [Clostridium sp. E14]